MDHVLQEGAGGERRRRVGLARVLPVLAAVIILAGAGYWIWRIWPNRDPVNLIKNGNDFERQKAAADLGVLHEGTDVDRVMAALVGAMDDEDLVVRSTAEQALGFLTAQLASRPGPATLAEKEQAERQLALAIQTLRKGLSDPEPTIRSSAAFGLGRLGQKCKADLPPELVTALADEAPTVRQAATKALSEAQLSASLVPALITALASPEREVRFQAAQSLGRVGPDAGPAVPDLIAILKEPLERQGTNDTVVVWDRDPACGAARALGQIGPSPETVAALTAMLGSEVPERASYAANGLEKLGRAAASAVPALIAAYDKVLKAREPVLGQSAIPQALGQLAPRSPRASEAISILIRGLDSPDTWVRTGAALALKDFGRDAARAITRLRELEDDPERNLRDAAKNALAAIETAPSAGEPPAMPGR